MFSFKSGATLLIIPLAVVAQSSVTAPLTNPISVPCPSGVALVRAAGISDNQSLSPAERSYISERASKVLPDAWRNYLQNVNSTSKSPLPSYVFEILTNTSNGTLPKLGIAVSGGGYRATLFGAGALSSFDGRNATAVQKTGTGGLLQAATYLSGLSGGSCIVIALAQANFPTIADLVFPPQQQIKSASENAAFGGFLLQVDSRNPGPDTNGTLAYLKLLTTEVAPKHVVADLPITITDIWSRTLARHFTNGTTMQNILTNGTHGAGVLFSDIANLPSFTSHQQPFPIIIGDSFSPKPNTSEFAPGATVPLTDEIWEFNVFETGSFDPTLASFTPTKLLGSTNSSHCIRGFDQASYIAALSSNIFSEFNTSDAALLASIAGPLISTINATFKQTGVRLDSAAVPNPFKGVNPTTFSNTNETFVTMLDGGLDGEVIPFQPLLVKARGVDTIIAIDVDSDTGDNFANGTELITSAKRAALFGSAYPFPAVPATADVFAQQNLTKHPTFFGCNDTSGAPLIIYIANGGPPASGAAPVTNTSNQQTTHSPQQVQAFLDQAFDISTQGMPSAGNGTDPQWGACLACAVVDRVRARTGAQRDGICGTCFERYCWNGNGTNTQPGDGGGGGSSGSNAAEKSMLASVRWSALISLGLIWGVIQGF